MKSVLLFVAICLFINFVRCDFMGQPVSETAKPDATVKDSELALLMRRIHEDSKQMRALIENNEPLAGQFPDYLNNLTTATPTDNGVKGELFDAMAGSFLFNMEEIYNFEEADPKGQFNLVVQSCIDCHKKFCPGPIKTIKKLRFREQ